MRALVAASVVVALAVPLPARGEWRRGAEGEVSLEGGNGSWIVRAIINGRLRGTFLLDTGASFCVLTPAAAERLGLAPGTQAVTLRTASGRVRAPLVQLASVEVGGTRAQGVQAVVHGAVDPPLDGVIGLSFLNRFSYEVVPSRRVLRLR
jgi:clan AA aspartic protease (TIGR02281 family)